MNNPTLNFDMISKILNIRMESKKEDRKKNHEQHKLLYKKCLWDITDHIRIRHWQNRR